MQFKYLKTCLSALVVLMLFSCGTTTEAEDTKVQEQGMDSVELNAYIQGVLEYQKELNHSFLSGANGVLMEDDLKAQVPLEFFPIDETYRVPAVFEPIVNGEVFEMKTSTDRMPLYKHYGVLHFKLHGDSLHLHVYQNEEHPEYHFIPFKDQTNGDESYGAGRYLDFDDLDPDNPILDFNHAYNPYCAYNYNYSCPMPPHENYLRVPIRAGVKKWK